MKPKPLPRPPYNPGVRALVRAKREGSRPLSQDAIEKGFLGWHENGYLPHRDEPGLIQYGDQYDLRAWVIMPNHVHLLFQAQEVPMWRLVDAWKGYTAKEANGILGRKGQFWQEGYWDTYMRDAEHEARTRRYVKNNPMKAQLVRAAKKWSWSSARFRNEYELLKLPPK